VRWGLRGRLALQRASPPVLPGSCRRSRGMDEASSRRCLPLTSSARSFWRRRLRCWERLLRRGQQRRWWEGVAQVSARGQPLRAQTCLQQLELHLPPAAHPSLPPPAFRQLRSKRGLQPSPGNSATLTLTRQKRARRRYLQASGSRRRCTGGRRGRSLAAGACAPPWPARCSWSPTSSLATS
jgi:hypothetical protein